MASFQAKHHHALIRVLVSHHSTPFTEHLPVAADRKSGVGFDDFQKCFIVRNSWGEDLGDKG